MYRKLYAMLDELAANAWPAPIQQQLESWRLRAAYGVTRRANSVLTLDVIPSYERWLDVVTDFYSSRGLPVQFQVSEASPDGLDGMLEGLGYTLNAPTSVQVAFCEKVLEHRDLINYGYDVLSFNEPNHEWLDAFMRAEGYAESKRDVYWDIISGIGPQKCFVRAQMEGQVVGVGMAVSERGWTGLFNIVTAPEHRGNYVATQVVQALARWSVEQGATSLYLQVMPGNQPAVSLYRKLGFSHLYGYHYRSLSVRNKRGEV